MITEEQKLEKIKQMVDMLASTPKEDLWKERQARFKKLAETHSVECIALASGLAVSSINQYLRVTDPTTIGGGGLTRAELILSTFK